MHILVVDDEPTIVLCITLFLRDLGHQVSTASHGREALETLATGVYHVVLTDIRMPGMDGIALLTAIKTQWNGSLDVIVFTGHGDEDMAIRALRAGAFDYLKKPLNVEELAIALERAEEHLHLQVENRRLTAHFDTALNTRAASVQSQLQQVEQALRAELGLQQLHIFSPRTQQVFDQARLFQAKRDVPVLIEGESGTGKELVARYLHYGDPVLAGPFVALNCASMTAELFQSELFGYEGGAFTGAKAGGSPGKLELAQRGTLFLDEISEIPMELQARLLRVLETREFYRVGGLKKLQTNARIVCATNRNLSREVAQGRFRRDLYHRINIGHIVLPPLRERRTEILPLAQAFLSEFNAKHGKHFQGFTVKAQQYLATQPWEGNVRELRNTIERAVILSEGVMLSVTNFGKVPQPSDVVQLGTIWELPQEGFDLEKYELEIVRRALARHGGNKTSTARYLGLSLKALQSRLRKL